MKPEIIVGLVTLVGGLVGGFLLRWVLPPSRAVADVEVRRLEQEYQAALLAVEVAKKTPGLADDERAFAVATARHNALIQAQRLRAALGAFE